jgi:hypothetical protein
MSKKDYIIRYLLIIRKLANGRLATFNEINACIENEFRLLDAPKSISLRTFQRDINEIRTIFNIDIQCSNHNQYYIAEDEQTGFTNRMMEAFDVFNSFTMDQKFKDYIIFERHCAIGTEHMYGLLNAIKNRFIVRFTYFKYYDETTSLREIEPYALKEFKGRWYLLSKDKDDDYIKTFALDRIQKLDITKTKFHFPEDVNPSEYFMNCYGITSFDDLEPEKIILSFNSLQGKYVKSYPIHDSQKVIADNETELKISLEVFQTQELLMELLSYGENMRVIRPVGLVRKITEIIKNMSQYYEE